MNCTEVDCTEIKKLIESLQAKDIPFESHELDGGLQVYYPSFENHKVSAITTPYSFGGRRGLIEIMGLLTESEQKNDEVLGHLYAANVLARIEADYLTDSNQQEE